ncbi:alpha/beta hydrolase [Shimia sp. R9_3]|uniref:alpha/beta fold hydrolase n=1 Tax=Shimia sp. R9_3 TaxID=2821113 RepID=UPI001ADBC06B|nr:alpha/beta hydrolase [Shimia sp. R9_3]MBO9402585.1 alpha/beta hydrolase [Shimia sp. R9_3]
MSIALSKFRSVVAAIALSLPVSAAAENASVVLVHGAFSDGSAWHRVIPILQDAGVSVSAAQLALADLQEDAATVTRLVELQDGPVVLVGHSYGGSVITEAGAHEKVEHLVYIAGFAMEAGQSLSDLTKDQPAAPWQSEIYPDGAGYLRLTATGISEFFASDLPASETAVMAVTQAPLKYDTNQDALSVAAWTLKPSSYVIAENDRIIPAQIQGYFAQKIGADVTTVPSSHVAMLAQPEAVAEVILNAVQAATSQ